MEQIPILMFQRYQIEKYHYDRKHNQLTANNEDDDYQLEVDGGISEDLKRGKITVELTLKTQEFNLNLCVIGYFDIKDGLEEKEIEKALVVNGTAMVFPYIRSMVSMLTSLDSENAVLLPTINTYNLL